MHPRLLVLASVLLVSPILTGCLGGDSPDDTVAPMAAEPDAVPEVGRNTTGGLGAAETNRTVGRPHIHDHWLDRTEIELLNRVVYGDLSPVFPDKNAGSGPMFQALFELDEGVLVYEGTGKLIVTAEESTPVAIPLSFQYRHAGTMDWSDPIVLTPGESVEIEVTPLTADSPHSFRSLWAFRYTSNAAVKALPPTTEIPTTVTAIKARNVEFWPSHPDFYADGPSRVVIDEDAKTVVKAFTDELFYDDRSTYIPAEKLVSMGTTRLEIFVNVSGYSGPPGTSPGDYYMVYRHPNLTYEENHDYLTRPITEGDGGPGTYIQFSNVTVGHLQHDPPYAEFSRWMFRLNNYINTGISFCGNCFSYELSYRITVVAWNDNWEAPGAGAETADMMPGRTG